MRKAADETASLLLAVPIVPLHYCISRNVLGHNAA
jgi:hypothetical protein